MSVSPFRPENFGEILSLRAEEQPHDVAYVFIDELSLAPATLTYGELDNLARQIANSLHEQCQPGDRVLLQFPSCLDFIAALFGCFYAGITAVPAYPPAQRHIHRLQSIISDSSPVLALTTAAVASKIRNESATMPELAGIPLLTVDTMAENVQGDRHRHEVYGDAVAFLQYTSGTTGSPKGVMITHTNLIENQRMIKSAFGHNRDTIVAGWLPLFHDMGLVGNVLQPLYLGVKCILMSPSSFIQRPVRWLKMISDYRATSSGGPDFAFRYCVRNIRPKQMSGIDLSCWKVAFSGSEMVRAETLQEFTKMFLKSKFSGRAFYPCYGMAEATLLITGGLPGSHTKTTMVNPDYLTEGRFDPSRTKDDRALSFVSCGQTWHGACVRIIDPETFAICENGVIGEIWVSGSNVATGYWNQTEASKSLFEARISGSKEGPFLRTGDLGVIYDGELWITGRLKDTIIIQGQNFNPTDIERVVQIQSSIFGQYSCCVFSVEINGYEKVVVVQEIARSEAQKHSFEAASGDILETVMEQFGLSVYSILFVQPGSLLKTSSGKIQRSKCRKKYLSGEFQSYPPKTGEHLNV